MASSHSLSHIFATAVRPAKEDEVDLAMQELDTTVDEMLVALDRSLEEETRFGGLKARELGKVDALPAAQDIESKGDEDVFLPAGVSSRPMTQRSPHHCMNHSRVEDEDQGMLRREDGRLKFDRVPTATPSDQYDRYPGKESPSTSARGLHTNRMSLSAAVSAPYGDSFRPSASRFTGTAGAAMSGSRAAATSSVSHRQGTSSSLYSAALASNAKGEDDWVDDCLREVDAVLEDLNMPPQDGAHRFHAIRPKEPSTGGGHHVEVQAPPPQRSGTARRTAPALSAGHSDASRRGSRVDPNGRVGPKPASGVPHLQLFDRLALWEERKEMKRMLGVYNKLIAEQEDCTFQPMINSHTTGVPSPTTAGDDAVPSSMSAHNAAVPHTGLPSKSVTSTLAAGLPIVSEEDSTPQQHSPQMPLTPSGRCPASVVREEDAVGTRSPPPPSVKGLENFVERMTYARVVRSLPQQEEAERLARYRDPTTFVRRHTTPEPFCLATAHIPSSHPTCIHNLRHTAARNGTRNPHAVPPLAYRAGSVGSTMSSPMPSRRRSVEPSPSPRVGVTGCSVLIRPAVRIQPPAGGSTPSSNPSVFTTPTKTSGIGASPGSGASFVHGGAWRGPGFGCQRASRLRDSIPSGEDPHRSTTIAAVASCTPAAWGPSPSRGGGAAMPSRDALYRTVGATLRKEVLFDPQFSAELQRGRCSRHFVKEESENEGDRTDRHPHLP